MKIVEIMVQITQNTNGNGLIWAVMESGCDSEKVWYTVPKQNLAESSFFEISTSNLDLD